MKLLTNLMLLAASIGLAQIQAVAVPITWDDPVAIKSASQIDAKGVLVHAGYWGSDPITVDTGSAKILFTGRKICAAGTTDGSAGTTGSGETGGAFAGDTGNSNFNKVLDSFAYDGENPRSATFEGLTKGRSYELQLFALDDRTDSGEADRPLRFGDKSDFTGSNSKVFKSKDNVFVIGHFKADDVKITIYEDIAQLGNLNAYVLRDVTAK